jgi:L-aspartate oxidase
MAYQIPNETARCDVLVLGSGIAGLLLCHMLSKSGMKVLLACKGKLIDSNTSNAQGGLAAVDQGPKATAGEAIRFPSTSDSNDLHLQDTLASGAGLTDPAVARSIVERGADLVERLAEFGVRFDRKDGDYERALEGGHSRPRILHSKDASGQAISTALIASLAAANNVTIWQDAYACELLLADGRCIGAKFLGPTSPTAVFARNVVLATGGLGRVFSRTTNPDIATGDGIAMAYRAGARLVDMEFVQFHPTALCKPGAPAALISEAARGAGAVLLDDQGERFVFRYDSRGELATRDVVARAIYSTMMERNIPSVFLDLRPIGSEAIAQRFPNIVAATRRFGVDPLSAPVPIAPAAHYFMGGILADACGRTSIPNLFAIGECASTGLHGANRLASNSLLEGGAMAISLAEVLQGQKSEPLRLSGGKYQRPLLKAPNVVPSDLERFRESMFRNVGLERSQERLEQILNSSQQIHLLASPPDKATAEAANIALLGYLIARCAYERKESRGAHFRCDYPNRDDATFQKRLVISKTDCLWLPVPTTTPAVPVRSPAAPLSGRRI